MIATLGVNAYLRDEVTFLRTQYAKGDREKHRTHKTPQLQNIAHDTSQLQNIACIKHRATCETSHAKIKI